MILSLYEKKVEAISIISPSLCGSSRPCPVPKILSRSYRPLSRRTDDLSRDRFTLSRRKPLAFTSHPPFFPASLFNSSEAFPNLDLLSETPPFLSSQRSVLKTLRTSVVYCCPGWLGELAPASMLKIRRLQGSFSVANRPIFEVQSRPCQSSPSPFVPLPDPRNKIILHSRYPRTRNLG